MNNREKVAEAFSRNIANHQIEIIADDGNVNRHIRFKRPDSGNMWYELVTWHNHLCIAGDMGTYVFSRIPDMFAFFRGEDGSINPGYWSEKVQSQSLFGNGVEEFSPQRFRDAFEEYIKDFCDGVESDRDAVEELQVRILNGIGVEDYLYVDSFDEAYNFVTNLDEVLGCNFSYLPESLGSCSEYTYHFLWCCHAIVWGINRYDETKQKEGAA